MKIAIRMIGITTSIFWLFLTIFSVSAMFSMKDAQFSFGEPVIGMNADGEMLFSLPIAIANKGFYSISSFNLSTEMLGEQYSKTLRGNTFIPVIRRNEVVNFTHEMKLNLTDLLRGYQNLLFNDTQIPFNETFSLRIADVIPIQASANISIPWGAPLSNFRLGTPELAPETPMSNASHQRVVVPLGFENHAAFDLVGTLQLHMYNSTDTLIGETETTFEASQHSSYQQKLELYTLKEGTTTHGSFQVFFTTSFFSYGPLVIHYVS